MRQVEQLEARHVELEQERNQRQQQSANSDFDADDAFYKGDDANQEA